MDPSGMRDPQLWRSSPGISLRRRAQLPCPVPITLLLPSSTQLAGVFPRQFREVPSKTRRHVCWSMPPVWVSSYQPDIWGEYWINSWCRYLHHNTKTSPTGMSMLTHYISTGCKSTRIITISHHRSMRVLAPAERPMCSAQPPNDFSKELAPMQGTSRTAFPCPSLSAYHGMAVKRK